MSTQNLNRKKSVDISPRVAQNGQREVLVLYIQVKVTERLYRAIADAADKAGLPLGRYLARLAARDTGLPEDAAFIPRKRMGRPRKHAVA